MSLRQEMLGALVVGDIFHAGDPSGENLSSLICLVTSLSDSEIHCRRMIVPQTFVFDRKAGTAISGYDYVDHISTVVDGIRINSIAPLQIDHYNTILWLDRKNRLQFDIEKAELSEIEIKALLFASEHYRSNPIK